MGTWGRAGAIPLALTLVVGVALGVVAGVAVFRDRGTAARAPLPEVAAAAAPAAAQASPLPVPSPVPLEAATTPEAAVLGFLAAEARGHHEASHAFLSEADRATWPTAAAWVAAHADLPPITGGQVQEVRDDAVVTATSLDARLDPVLGLVPARATGTWATVREAGGVRVHFSASTLQPAYPSDEGVGEAVTTWAEARARCTTAAQADAPLLGSPGLADRLCGAPGALDLGAPGTLVEGERTLPLLDAYGPEVFAWARAVDVRAPVAMTVVAAPIGESWLVVAVLPPPV